MSSSDFESLFPPNFTSKPPPDAGKEVIPQFRHSRRVDPLKIDFGYNPRRSDNPMYEQIKADILHKGDLDHPIPICWDNKTERFKTHGGGNTRLKIVKEAWEGGDDRFRLVRCEFHPWIDRPTEVYGAGVENYLRGQLSFIELALWMKEVKEAWEAELGEKFSVRVLERWLKNRAGWGESGEGWAPARTTIARWLVAAGYYPFIPLALGGGLGKRGVESLSKLQGDSYRLYQFYSGVPQGDNEITNEQYLTEVFGVALGVVDHSTEFNLQIAADAVIKHLSDTLALDRDLLAKQLAYVQKGGQMEDFAENSEVDAQNPAVPSVSDANVSARPLQSEVPAGDGRGGDDVVTAGVRAALSWDSARSLLLKMAENPAKKRVAELPVIFDELDEVDDLLAIRAALDARIAEKGGKV